VAWEQRTDNGRRYYVQKLRRGRHVTSRYIGSGPQAESLAAEVARQAAKREVWRQEKAVLSAAEAEIAAFSAQVERLLEEALSAAGYHKPARGRWRKKRDGKSRNKPGPDTGAGPAAGRD
jgi:hypothetical protein